MADDKVQLCNLALGHIIAGNSIQSFDENSNEAAQCRLYYDPCRKFVLRDHRWAFAKVRVTLASSGTPPEEWLYQYAYPSDCLKALRIYNPLGKQATKIQFTIAKNPDGVGRVILTNQPEAELIYTKDETDVTTFDPQFDLAFSLYLASFVGMPITGDRVIVAQVASRYTLLITDAKVADVEEQPDEIKKEAPWIAGRG